MSELCRRSFLGGLIGGLVAAPFVIRTAGLLMPIRAPAVDLRHRISWGDFSLINKDYTTGNMRRLMPALIAEDLVGVQPMTGDVRTLFVPGPGTTSIPLRHNNRFLILEVSDTCSN